jgi:hypothetical protein
MAGRLARPDRAKLADAFSQERIFSVSPSGNHDLSSMAMREQNSFSPGLSYMLEELTW